ncbi:hypothetical protein SV7mr_29170 [Stieleria bergensis]|uniref:S-adenosylmethionine:diacylglycerol 3-amino-3-carboxypropyl transferase n=1 Tax=Stieleria bergensis TaxID=2528025 RepID=A0A517SW83_9BACT|nr:MAG: S-adenosylmethionine--diacylglycerol 3-amino-3-carboxypropyl transferase [Rhodopirellula sp. TMED11]QDT60395.1 hypothetical protein SV7mr_29170 [Planctomycetes bacterium SV_7m_r]
MISDWIGRRCFSLMHQRNLVYNTCWEDPRLDRQALKLSPEDSVMVITSAGCNALDYALQGPKAVHAVDMNHHQNALLELKLASIGGLDYEDFFQVFGTGMHPHWREIYYDVVRGRLREQDQRVWDRRINFFDGTAKRKSFYFRGTSGTFAWMINGYLNRPKGLRATVEEMLAAASVDRQAEIYESQGVSNRLFSKSLRWALRRDTTMAMLGVPRSQRMQIDCGYPGGLGGFIQDRIETVFKRIPLRDNYFWRVYLTGSYTKECCPEYLTEAGFQQLKDGYAQRVHTHTNTVESFLGQHQQPISRFVLLDHMDWLYHNYPELLAAEWQSIVNRADRQTRILWRSAALSVDFVDPLNVQVNGRCRELRDLLEYDQGLAESLHQQDRVHTYGSFYIADLMDVAA